MNIEFIEKYYTNKIKEFGPTSKGVDWKDSTSQNLRFSQLIRDFVLKKEDTILDFGCGYGALLDYLINTNISSSYYGYDISEAMLEEAKKKFSNEKRSHWSNQLPKSEKFDYSILSGIFNVRNEQKDNIWKEYILDTLNQINGITNKGFSFNILTSFSDPEYRKEYLYYADPLFFFDYCKKNFSKYVNLFHDYPLYEFTITIKRNPNG